MMLVRAITRSNTLHACANRNFTKNLNTKAGATIYSESKPKTFQNDSQQSASEHLKSATVESVSC